MRFFNQNWCEYTGLTLEQFLGSGWLATLQPLLNLWKQKCQQLPKNDFLLLIKHHLSILRTVLS